MKRIVILLIIMVSTLGTFAQSTDAYFELMHSVLQTEKKAKIIEVMVLSESEKEPFWKLYDEYDSKLNKIQSKNVEAIIMYDSNRNDISEETIDNIYTIILKARADAANLEKVYYKKFKKVLSTEKTVRFFQTEHKIKTMLAAELAIQVPLLDIK